MSLNPFNRDTAYFQLMRDRNMMINAEDLDFQFNNLTDYLNKRIVPIVNLLSAREIPGVNDPNLVNAALLNVGDGTTKWVKVGGNIIDDYTLSFEKFVKDNFSFWGENNGSIIATDNTQIFSFITPIEENNILLSRLNNSPVWRKTETGDIENKSITGIKIGLQSIGLEHLPLELTTINLTPNSILSDFILNGSITGEKLQDNVITAQKLNDDLIQERLASIQQRKYQFLDNSLDNRHFLDGILVSQIQIFGQSAVNEGFNSLAVRPGATQPQPQDYDSNVQYTFSSDNIIDNSVEASMFDKSVSYFADSVSGQRLATEPKRHFVDKAIETKHIIDYSVRVRGLTDGTVGLIGKEKLDPTIRQKLGI